MAGGAHLAGLRHVEHMEEDMWKVDRHHLAGLRHVEEMEEDMWKVDR